MNKKYIAYSFMAILAVTMASAGLVNYLSNTVTGEVSITSPIELSGDITETIYPYAGETIIRTILMENKANVPITTHSEIIVIAPTAWSDDLEEFDTLTLTDGSSWIGDFKNPVTFGLTDKICNVADNNAKKLVCVLGDATPNAGETITYTLTAGFNQAIAPGEYSFTVQAMN